MFVPFRLTRDPLCVSLWFVLCLNVSRLIGYCGVFQHRIGDVEALAKGQEEFIAEVGQKLSQQKVTRWLTAAHAMHFGRQQLRFARGFLIWLLQEELGWRSKLKSDPEMIDSIKQNIFDV